MEFRSAVELRADFIAGRASPVEVVDQVLERIDTLNGRLGAFYTLNENARRAAVDAEKALRAGKPVGPLHGIPISIKDLIATADIRTTRGSAIFEQWIPDSNAPVVERVLAAGAIVIGKTSTAEFGWKGVTDAPLFGQTRNPWNLDFTPGGSSGGGAAAVASGMGPLAVTTDAAGSTRLPAAFCGVFGMKPSFGRIPVYPAPAADTLVHLGLMTRTVKDCALLLSVVAGPDERDRNSLPPASLQASQGGFAGIRAAWCPRFGKLPIEPVVIDKCAAAIGKYQQAGLAVDEITLELPDLADAFRVLFQGTFGAQLVDALPKWREKLDPGLVEMVEAGRKLSAYDLAKAGMARSAHYDAMRKVFDRYDILLLPVAGTPAFRLGSNSPTIAGAPASYPDWLGFLYPFNLSGQPAATVPCGWTDEGLPIGLQIAGRRFQDARVLQVADAFEEILPWAHRKPPLT